MNPPNNQREPQPIIASPASPFSRKTETTTSIMTEPEPESNHQAVEICHILTKTYQPEWLFGQQYKPRAQATSTIRSVLGRYTKA